MKRAVDLLATCPDSPSASFLARHNLACLLRNELDFDAALREWDAVLREPLPPNDAPARYARTTSEVEFADLLGRIAAPRGDSDLLRKAVAILDAAIARERVPELPGTRAQVHRALVDRIFAVIALTAWERQGAELDGVREKLASNTLVSTLAWVGSDAWDRPDAAIEEYVRLADEWGVDEISHHAGRLKAMFGAQNALATAKASILPWTSVAEKRGEKEDDSDQFHAAVADEMHVQTLARLARFYRYGQPFVLLLRSFGEIAVAHAPGAPVPMVSMTYPTPSIGHELDGAVAAWLERIAPVVSVTQQSGMVFDETDRIFPRLTLGENWLEEVSWLAQEAAGIVAVVTRDSEGLLAELREVHSRGLAERTVLIIQSGIDEDGYAAFPHRITLRENWRDDPSDLTMNVGIIQMCSVVEAARMLPVNRRAGVGISLGRPYSIASGFLPPGWVDRWEEDWLAERKRMIASIRGLEVSS